MGITSRKKRVLKKEIPHLRDTSLIIIASEGEVTEKAYFESVLFNSTRVQVKVLETEIGFSSLKAVYRRLRDFKKKYQLYNSDKLWLVIDRDRWEVKNLSTIASDTRKLGAGLAMSNPCFELWLYLHFAEWTGGAISSGEIENCLRVLLGSYNKSAPPISKLSGKVADACSRAEQMDSNPRHRWPDNPGSHVYRLVKEINALTGNRSDCQ
jgi:hypothetical protein